MPRMPLLAPTVLMSLSLLPGACFAQPGFAYGAVVPARLVVQNVPTAASGRENQTAPPRGHKTITFSAATVAKPPASLVGVEATRGGQPLDTANNPPTVRPAIRRTSAEAGPLFSIRDERL